MFKKFDYGNPPDDGLYWVRFEEPVYKVDIDDYGRAVGAPTGEIESYITLVEVLSYIDDDAVYFDSIADFRQLCETAVATHYAEVMTPDFCEAKGEQR